MPFKDVMELRKSGNLNEALNKAEEDLANDPNDIWNKRSIAWVYYDYLKSNASIDNYEQFKNYLSKLSELNLPEEEKMIFDNSAFQVGKIVFEIQKEEHPDFSKLNELFDLIKGFHFTKPSEAYTFLYKAFHKGYHNWSRYAEFADWWDFNNFISSDYLPEEYKGKKIMSIVEQGYIAYSKKLLEGEIVNQYQLQKSINKDKLNAFLPKLELIIEKHPEYQYPPYFKAKILIALGDKEDLLSSFIPFAKKKRNDFWVWELMADTFPNRDERKKACLCKALSLNTPDDFLINTRIKLAEILLIEQRYPEAKLEIRKSVEAREKQGWKIPNQIIEKTEQDWYKDTTENKDNSNLYNQYKKMAEQILFQNDPEETAVVEFVNENKRILNFVINKMRYGFFNYDGLIENPQIGDIIKIRIKGEQPGEYFKVYTVRKVENEENLPALNKFHGIINIIEKSNIGFVGEVFFDSNFISKNNIKQSQIVKGLAVLSFNKKKNEWGWKAVKLT